MTEFAVVDIETTGGYSANNRIIEVAIVLHDGKHPVDFYHTLVNPNRGVPSYITGLTGISSGMVSDAPTFKEVAGEIFNKLEGKVFAAHSVNFDYSFIKKELAEAGYDFNARRLCTVKASRKIFPGQRSYSLGRICESLQITIESRHRAMGDAAATATLLSRLIENDKHNTIHTLIKRNSGEWALPDNISKEKYESIPDTTGVYYFYDDKGKIIYIGKALNLKSRIKSHFTSNGDKGKNRFWSRIHDIKYFETGSELIALILEAQEIKKHYPPFNKALKSRDKSSGILQYEDRSGYIHLVASNNLQGQIPLVAFRSLAEARMFLMEKMEQFELCGKYTGLQTTKGACQQYHVSACKGACTGEEPPDDYNARVHEVIHEIQVNQLSFCMIDEGKSDDEYAIIYVENGIYRGHGYINKEDYVEDATVLKSHLDYFPESRDVNSIIYSFMEKENMKILYLRQES